MTISRELIRENIHNYISDRDNNSLLDELREELEFQKQILLHRFSYGKFNDNVNYYCKLQENYVKTIFGKKSESYFIFESKFRKNILTEELYDFEKQINRFNKFLIDNLKNSPNLNEQNAYVPAFLPEKTNNLAQVVDYIKKNGVNVIFENIRKALLSGVGGIIQAALSFTGVGSVAVEAVWAIMTLYDAYQYFFNSGSLMNLVLDIICVISMGNLVKWVKGFFGRSATSIQSILQMFKQTKIWSSLEPFLVKISGYAQWFEQTMKNGAKFCEEKMGITWVKNALSKLSGLFKEFSKDVSNFIGKTVSNVTHAFAEIPSLLGLYAKIPQEQAAKWTATGVEKLMLKMVDKLVEKHKNEKIEVILDKIDKQFGTQYVNFFKAYVDIKKLSGHQAKLAGGISRVDLAADATFGTNTFDKTNKYYNRIPQYFEPSKTNNQSGSPKNAVGGGGAKSF